MEIHAKPAALYAPTVMADIPAPSAPVATVAKPAPNDDKATAVARPDLERAVSAIQAFADASARQLDFSIDEATGQVVVKVIARQSGEVIRQLPSEAALRLAENLKDTNSLLFDSQV